MLYTYIYGKKKGKKRKILLRCDGINARTDQAGAPLSPSHRQGAIDRAIDRAIESTVSSRGRGAMRDRSRGRSARAHFYGGIFRWRGISRSARKREETAGTAAASLLILDTQPVTLTAARIMLDERNITGILRRCDRRAGLATEGVGAGGRGRSLR
jgi:hypothetical protein